MPELPEVETMRRGIAGVVGARIVGVERAPCPRKPIEVTPSAGAIARRVVGRRIERTDRVGKRVVVWLDSDEALVFEPRMTGLVLVTDPPDPLYSRLRVVLEHDGQGRGSSAPGSARGSKREKGDVSRGATLRGGERLPTELLYWDRRGLGNVRLVTRQQFDQRYGLHVLGPDALVMTAELYRERLGKSARAIKVALLDQKAVAGIGNLYASEILHLAEVHPARACRRVTRAQWKRIAAAALEVLETAIRYEGSTLSDGTYRNALNKAGGYQNEHRVYDKAGQRCPRRGCGGAVARIVQAQRATFFCPGCQRR
jgi:formamidopyrimidine-DNA glycosylase